jgi:transketolase
VYPILDEIYKNKQLNDSVVLSCGHAGLALYVKLEELYGFDPVQMVHDFGIHPVRDVSRNIEVSSGSLGSAIMIACGMALGDATRDVHCIISDGECAEGSVWEALHFANRVPNLKVHVNVNGFSAYDPVDSDNLIRRLAAFLPSITIHKTKPPSTPFFEGLKAHYHVMSEDDYMSIKE